MLQRGDSVPHFRVRTTAGELFSYLSIWQRKTLVLVVARPDSDDSYVSAVTGRSGEFRDRDAVLVITRDEITGMSAPGVLIADKWGEVMHVAHGCENAALPPPTGTARVGRVRRASMPRV